MADYVKGIGRRQAYDSLQGRKARAASAVLWAFRVLGAGEPVAATSGGCAGRGSDGVRKRCRGVMPGSAEARMCSCASGRLARHEQERRRKRAGCTAG